MAVVKVHILNKWQELVNSMARFMKVPSALIMKLDKPEMEVLVASQNESNPASVGARADWAKIYCGEAIRSRKPQWITNALNDERWADNPLLELNLVSYLGYPLFLPNGQPFGTICILDIKENPFCEDYKEILGHFKEIVENDLSLAFKQEELIARNEELEILKDRLRTNSINLEKSNKELKDFATLVSHDLKEPLRKIIYFENKLREEESDDRRKSYLKRISDSALRMNRLIEEMLQLSQLEYQVDSFDTVDLNRVIIEVLNDLEIPISESKALIQLEHLPTIRGNQTQLYRMFQNLVANALKFHKEDQLPVIRIWEPLSGEDYNQVCIRDEGIGMTPDALDKVFKPLERLHSTSEYEGSGLGLSIVQKIVTMHDGTISIESSPNEGTTFTLKFPQNIHSRD